MRKSILPAAVLFVGLATFILHYVKETREQRILTASVIISITTPSWQQMAEASEEALPIPSDEYPTMAEIGECPRVTGCEGRLQVSVNSRQVSV